MRQLNKQSNTQKDSQPNQNEEVYNYNDILEQSLPQQLRPHPQQQHPQPQQLQPQQLRPQPQQQLQSQQLQPQPQQSHQYINKQKMVINSADRKYRIISIIKIIIQ